MEGICFNGTRFDLLTYKMKIFTMNISNMTDDAVNLKNN